MFKHFDAALILVVTLSLSACSSGDSTGDTDNSALDDETTTGLTSGDTDAGAADSGSTDSGSTDSGSTDSGTTDSGGNQTASLAQAIQGAWMGVCSNYDFSGTSVREINAITSTQLIQDFYEYDGSDCQGVPRGKTYPLRIYDYVLGSDVISDEGVSAVLMDLVVTQVSDVGYLRDGVVLGETFYDIIGVDTSGTLRKSYFGSRKEDSRTMSLPADAFMVPRTPLTAASFSAQDLVGTYSTGCLVKSFGSSNVTETLDENGVLTGTEDFYGNEICSGAASGQTERKTEYIFEDSFTSVFGDTLIRFVSTQNPKRIVFNEDFLSDDFDLGTLKVRYDAVGLAGDTMLRGYCVLTVSECRKDSEHYADMLDLEFDSDTRYKRVEP